MKINIEKKQTNLDNTTAIVENNRIAEQDQIIDVLSKAGSYNYIKSNFDKSLNIIKNGYFLGVYDNDLLSPIQIGDKTIKIHISKAVDIVKLLPHLILDEIDTSEIFKTH